MTIFAATVAQITELNLGKPVGVFTSYILPDVIIKLKNDRNYTFKMVQIEEKL